MTINQLFKKRPSDETLLKILEDFIIFGLNDTKSFTKKDLAQFETVNKDEENKQCLTELLSTLQVKIYLNNLNEKEMYNNFKTDFKII